MIDFGLLIADNLQVMAGASVTEQQTVPELPGAFELFRPSWEALRRNLFTFFYLPVLPFIVAVCAATLVLSTTSSRIHFIFLGAGVVAGAAAVVLFLIALPAMTYVQLRSVQGQVVEFGEALTAGRRYFWRLWGVRISSGFLILFGLILLIVPGLFMMRRYLLAPYFVIEENLGVFDAMRRSAAISRKYSAATWDVVGVRWLITAMGLVPLIGYLADAIMNFMYYCAAAVRFEQIKAAELDGSHKRTTPKRQPKAQSRPKKSS